MKYFWRVLLAIYMTFIAPILIIFVIFDLSHDLTLSRYLRNKCEFENL